MGHEEVARRMLGAAGIGTLLVDTGFLPLDICTPAEVAAFASDTTRSHEILRLETTAESLLADGTDPKELRDAVKHRLVESEAVGAKSIAAYRCGLDLLDERPRDIEVAAALHQQRPPDGEPWRITDRTVISALAWTAIEARLPLQLHVGYGDNDVDLLRCDPLHLTPFLRATQSQSVPVLLLHNYPFHRHAAYLAQVFDHVFMDVGLAVHNTGDLSRRVIEETLELVPFGKLLHSSDAFGLAELYYLGTLLFRRGLDEVLAGLVGRDELTEVDARRIGEQVARGNARRAYALS
jgi:predicted TIM-barrel fold metal-dependent hydrolase